jgi:pyruvate carboxylase
MRTLGNKIAARNAAVAAGVPVMPATDPLPDDLDQVKEMAGRVGYPFMLKASWGGGGRGMRVIESEADLASQIDVARRESKAAFGNDEVYLEKLVRRARHVEVQILGDRHGNLVHLFERDCTVQRRNQKVVERAPAPYLDQATREALCDAALRLGRAVGYSCAGTVEFLMDADSGEVYLEAARMLVDEGLAAEADFPWDSDGYRAPTADFIDGVSYDGRTPNAYIDSLGIGLKGGETIEGAEVAGG